MPSTDSSPLLASRRFLPLFIVQFLGAFNDNVFKSAFTILATFHYTTQVAGWEANVATQAIAGVFILPFFLFSGLAGQLADKFDKSRLVRLTKLWEIGAMGLAGLAFALDNPWLLFGTLFLMGSQSAFFGPLKYSLLPQHLKEEELVSGNAIFEAATYVSILLGTIVGSLYILKNGTPTPGVITVGVLVIAALGWLASRFVPAAPSVNPDLKVNLNPLTSTFELLGYLRTQKGVFRSVLGISWFWVIGIFWLSQVPAYVKDFLKADERIVTYFFILFSLGVGAGSLACSRILKGTITAKFVPLAGMAISVFMADIAWLTTGIGNRFASESFEILSPLGIRLSFDLLGIAVSGGLFSVPLYAMMQAWSEPERRSRTIAANNIMNALFMTGISVVTALLFSMKVGNATVIALVATANFVVALYVVSLVPESVIHTFARWGLRLLFKVEVRGLENYVKARRNRVIIANHTSFLDAALLTVFLPERPTFAINTEISKKWWIKPFLWAVNVHPLDPTKPMAIKILTELAREGVPIVIFPEGRLTVTGALMKVYEGPGLIADKADADLIPIQISGALYSKFSRLGGKVRQRWFPKITLTVLEPRPFHPPAGVKGKAARQYMARELYEILARIGVETADTRRTLFGGLIDAAKVHGSGFAIVDDIQGKALTYRRLIAGSRALGRKLCADSEPGEAIGLLIANSSAAIAAFFGVQSQGRVCAMLNYSAGASSLAAACQTACIRIVWTSRRFVTLGKLESAVEAMAATGADIRYLEDAAKFSVFEKLRLLCGLARGSSFYRDPGCAEGDKPAVILFTSGSSGTPKGVVLSHRNLQTNRYQLAMRIDLNRSDKVFNCLPVFHAFGMTGGTILPILSGVPVFMYPTPLHYGIVPELVYQTNSTILFGTNTFLSGYARRAHPYDFFNVRYIFAGAEKLKDSVRQVYAEKFGARIFEGYGATETAPGLTSNSPMFNQPGSVGRFLPGIEWRLDPMPGVEKGGRLWVRGGNVMLGYYLIDKPGQLQPPDEGWYDTGDIVDVDTEGFVNILGRAKRFAKIAGEMVSLTAVEELASAVYPNALHAAISRPHPQKGEEIILATEQADAERSALSAAAKERGVPELAVPRQVVFMKQLPILGSGKPDYVTLEKELKG